MDDSDCDEVIEEVIMSEEDSSSSLGTSPTTGQRASLSPSPVKQEGKYV